MAEDRNLLDKIRDKAKVTADALKKQYGIGSSSGNPWPQTQYMPKIGSLNLLELYPKYKTRGWLPPILIPVENPQTIGQYTFTDWRGVELKLNTSPLTSSKYRFNASKELPKKDLNSSPNEDSGAYSTRDIYRIFNDTTTDYFRHGLQIIDNLNKMDDDGVNSRLSSFKSTPFENNDPVIFGFEIIIDDPSSPLLNGSINSFLDNYSNISEVASRIPVYEDFRQQFIKFFKTKTYAIVPDINDKDTKVITHMTKMRGASESESDSRDILSGYAKKAYLGYYLKKVAGLEKLIESNTGAAKKYLADYNKDVISLSFTEDVSLSLGTLAHLYKLLYWSKPNGKGLIPENLLRFNCDIIVSEVRNFKRVRKAIDSNNIEVIKDNVSRYIYSLKECQFYFNTMPHDNEVDLGSIKTFDNYTIQFDYKYSTVKFEKFVPTSNGFGQYVGYNGGAIWRKVGSGASVGQKDSPTFLTKGENNLNQEGVLSPFVLSFQGDQGIQGPTGATGPNSTIEEDVSGFQKFKQNSKTKAKELKGRLEDQAIKSAQRELQSFVNTRVALLNKTLNKILNSAGITGIRPPKNIYTDSIGPGGRIFYDVRGEVLNFLGDSLGGAIGGSRNRSF